MAGFPTLKGWWPWPLIGSYCIPSCITHRPLPTWQISWKDGPTFETGFIWSTVLKSRPNRGSTVTDQLVHAKYWPLYSSRSRWDLHVKCDWHCLTTLVWCHLVSLPVHYKPAAGMTEAVLSQCDLPTNTTHADCLTKVWFHVTLDTNIGHLGDVHPSQSLGLVLNELKTKPNTTKASNIVIKWSKLTQTTLRILHLSKHTKTKSKRKPTCNFKNRSHACAYQCAQPSYTAQHRMVLVIFLPNFQTIIAAAVGRAFSHVCVRSLKEKWLEPSTPTLYLVHVYSIAVAQHPLTGGQKCQRSRSHCYYSRQHQDGQLPQCLAGRHYNWKDSEQWTSTILPKLELFKVRPRPQNNFVKVNKPAVMTSRVWRIK